MDFTNFAPNIFSSSINWIYIALASAFFMGVKDVMSKRTVRHSHTASVVFLLGITCSLGILILFYPHVQFNLSIYNYLGLAAKALIVAVAWYFLFHAYKHLEISTVTPLKNLSSVFAFFLGMIILLERPSLMQIIAVFILVIATYALELKNFKEWKEPLMLFKSKYYMFIMLALILEAIASLIDKILVKTVTPYSMTFYTYGFIAIYYLGFLIYEGTLSTTKRTIMKHPLLLLTMTCFFIAGETLYYGALAAPGSLVILVVPLVRLSALVSVFIGGSLFHEHRLWQKGTIAIIMAIGVYMMIVG